MATGEVIQSCRRRTAGKDQAMVRRAAARLGTPRPWSSPATALRSAASTCGAWARADLTGVLAQRHIARPMQSILHMPVVAYRPRASDGIVVAGRPHWK